MATPPEPRPPVLAERLRLETRALHAEAERSGVMADLLRGRLGRATYCALLRNLHAIYAALEAALGAHRADALIGAVQSPSLCREAALAADLVALHGPDWRDEIAVAPATAAYVARLQALAAAGAPALVAHAYVRYLGDLHGGQLLKRRVAGQLGLQDEGTRFYEFGDAGQVQALIARFRAALGTMQPGTAVVDFIVAEARWAFEQHKRLFEQLQPA
jgi:heme oxygenase (biliverdin-producing, ferredoxin)